MTGTGAIGGDVAIDAKGNILVLWQRQTGSGWVTAVVARPRGGRFGRPLELSTEADEWSELAYNSRGDVVVKLEHDDHSRCEFARGCARRIKVFAGNIHGRFGAPIVLTESGSSNASLALGSNGDVAVVWNSFTPGVAGEVLVARRPPGGSFGSPQQLAGGQLADPRVALDARGRAIVAWIERPAARIRVFAGSRGTDLREGGPLPVAANAVTLGTSLSPSGAGVIYWSSGSTSSTAPLYGILAPRFGSFTRRVQFSGGAGGRILAGPRGRLLACWAELRDPHSSHVVFDPYAALGDVRNGFRRAVSLAARGGVDDPFIDGAGRALLVVGGTHLAELRAGRPVTRMRLPFRGTVAASASGHMALLGMAGSYPTSSRLRVAWR